jgi:AraC family transcriptional regulator
MRLHDTYRPKPDLVDTATPPMRTKLAVGSLRGLGEWQMRKVLVHIEVNLSQRLQTQDLADLAGISLSHFFRAFRISQGEAPQAYVAARRIERAKQAMRDSERPLCEIALECGLYDQAHFTRMFRRRVGETPCAWRRGQMNRQRTSGDQSDATESPAFEQFA